MCADTILDRAAQLGRVEGGHLHLSAGDCHRRGAEGGGAAVVPATAHGHSHDEAQGGVGLGEQKKKRWKGWAVFFLLIGRCLKEWKGLAGESGQCILLVVFFSPVFVFYFVVAPEGRVFIYTY